MSKRACFQPFGVDVFLKIGEFLTFNHSFPSNRGVFQLKLPFRVLNNNFIRHFEGIFGLVDDPVYAVWYVFSGCDIKKGCKFDFV